MNSIKITAIAILVAALLILLSSFSNALLTKSSGSRTFKMGYTAFETCRGSSCRTTGINKLEQDLPPVAFGILGLHVLIGLFGFISAIMLFTSKDINKSLKSLKLFFIFSIVGLLLINGWVFTIKHLHGIIRLKLEPGWGYFVGLLGYITAIGSYFFLKQSLKKEKE